MKEGDLGDLEEIDRLMQFQNKLISIEDAASMYRVRVRTNTPPYQAAMMRMNNRLVDEWKESVLRKYSKNTGKVQCAVIEPSWQRFYEGKQVIKLAELHADGKIPSADPDVLEWWIKLFETSDIEDLHPYGSGLIHMGWKMVEDHIRVWSALQKYERVYSKSDDPYEWNTISQKNEGLFKGQELPFWGLEKLNEIREKIITVISIQPIAN